MSSAQINQSITYIKPRVFFVALVLVLLSTIMSYHFSRDASGYHGLTLYYSGLSLTFWQTFNQSHEALLIWLSLVVGYFKIDDLIVFFVYALLSVSIKVYLIDKKSQLYWLSLGFYVSYFFLFQDGTAIRASLAAGLLYFSLLLIESNKLFLFVLSVLLVSFFVHYSAMIFLVMLLLQYKKSENVLAVMFFLSTLLILILDKSQVISFFMNFLSIVSNDFYGVQKLTNYLGYAQNSTEYYSPFKLQSFIAYFFAVVFWFYKDEFSQYEMLCYKAFLFSLVLFVGFSYVPGWQQRFSDIFAFSFVFLVPYAYEFFKQFMHGRLAVTVVLSACGVLFIKLVFIERLIVI